MLAALSELDRTISLLEARLPANPDSPQNAKLAREMQKDVAEYFRQIEMALPQAEFERLYYSNVKQD